MVEDSPTEQYNEASGMDLSKKGFQRHEAAFWTYCRQPLPWDYFRVARHLPRIGVTLSGTCDCNATRQEAARLRTNAEALSAVMPGSDLNEVLLNLTEPGIFVTLACVRWRGDGRLEYALAGHPPIFHYLSSTESVSELRMEQLPIAMFPGVTFQSRTITVAAGDLLAIVSDGVLEVENSKGEEFGSESVKNLVVRGATKPLSRIVDSIVEETTRFGTQRDDQTILLVRPLMPMISGR